MKRNLQLVSACKLRQYFEWLCFIFTLFAFPVMASNFDNKINAIDFKRNANSQGVLTLTLTETQATTDIRKSGKQLNVDILDAAIRDDMLYVLDVTDFGTLVNTIETFRTEKGTKLVLKMSDHFYYDYDLVGKVLTVKVNKKPQANVAVVGSQTIAYKGKPISINFQDVPIRNVLQLIAEYNDFNLVVSDTVTGNLTLRLDDVPWQQVLDIILQVKGLDKRVEGSVVLVAPEAELTANEQKTLKSKRTEQELSVLRSELISVNYAKADVLAELLSANEGGVSMLSPRGSIHVDSRTNLLIVKDLDHVIDDIKGLVASLDIPVKQVQIEARIVTVEEGDLDQLGFEWNASSEFTSSTQKALNNTGELSFNLEGGGAIGAAFQFAKLGDYLLDLELNALQRESKAEVISSPRLLTTNKQAAYIEQGTEIPYLESTSSGATSVAFKKAVLSLSVTPQITPDNRLILDLVVTQDTVGENIKTGTGEVVSIKTQRIGTQVLVNNGETIVLGGVYQNSKTKSVSKVPLLGDIPGLGVLFRNTSENLSKRELLIFVTPKIVFQ